MDHKTIFSQLRDLIASDDLAPAIQQLRALLDNSPQLDEAIVQSARFFDIRQQIRLGSVRHEDANLTQNQIRTGLLDLLREIEEQAEQPVIREELEQAVSVVSSKNMVTGSTITAGGDVHIGDKNVIQNADKIYNIEKIDNANFS